MTKDKGQTKYHGYSGIQLFYFRDDKSITNWEHGCLTLWTTAYRLQPTVDYAKKCWFVWMYFSRIRNSMALCPHARTWLCTWMSAVNVTNIMTTIDHNNQEVIFHTESTYKYANYDFRGINNKFNPLTLFILCIEKANIFSVEKQYSYVSICMWLKHF